MAAGFRKKVFAIENPNKKSWKKVLTNPMEYAILSNALSLGVIFLCKKICIFSPKKSRGRPFLLQTGHLKSGN